VPFHTLKDILPGQKAIVKKISGSGAVRRRLLEMGLISGNEVEMIRYAPLGDPVEIKTNGALLSLRKEEAALIEIALSDTENSAIQENAQ